MNKFHWGGQDKKGVNLDENSVRMTGNLRMQMGILASALINEGKKDKAKKVLDLCLEKMPDENIPFDATIFSLCISYYELKEFEKANALSKKLFSIFEGDLRIYEAQIPKRKYAYGREINQSKELLKRLTGLAQQYKQDALYKEFMSKLQTVLTPEDINPSSQEPIKD